MDKICVGAAAAAAMLAILLLWGSQGADPGAKDVPEYASRLFDDSRVHTVNIKTDDWENFLEEAPKEEYISCTVEIDGEEFRQVGLRAKGNNSLRLTESYGLSRYSLKLEFDHFLDGGNYHGLDKLSLDASFQDNSYLKTYMAYDMMAFMGVPAPLCSYARVLINGEDWGLFLAIEEPEEAFVRRNFGEAHGRLYKPDYRSLQDQNDDLALKYIDDDPESYPNIFDHAKTDVTEVDQRRLIRALEVLDSGENLDSVIHVEEVLRYFVVQVFVMNWDSYVGHTGHNYYLYEEDGVLSILPWDYNLAFGTYAQGMSEPIKDPYVLINYPIYTPAEGAVMRERPLYHQLMKDDRYFALYRTYFDEFLTTYFESGTFAEKLEAAAEMIGPYVEEDPTRFCSYEDHKRAVETLKQVCLLRAESARGQLGGRIPATLRAREEYPNAGVDTTGIFLEDLGDFGDLAHNAQ